MSYYVRAYYASVELEPQLDAVETTDWLVLSLAPAGRCDIGINMSLLSRHSSSRLTSGMSQLIEFTADCHVRTQRPAYGIPSVDIVTRRRCQREI